MWNLSQIPYKAAHKTTPTRWKQLIKTVSTIPSSPAFTEGVRPHASGHVAGQGDGWLLGQGRWQHQRRVSPAKAPRWPWAPQPWLPATRCAPSATSGQHLPDPSWRRIGKSQTAEVLCGDPQSKGPQQTVELNGTKSLAFHESLRVGGWRGTSLASTATARHRFAPPSSLCSQGDTQLLLLNQTVPF